MPHLATYGAAQQTSHLVYHRDRPPHGSGFEGFRLVPILHFFAARDGDLETRIALRSKNLSSPWAYLQLAKFCRTHGREDEALHRAEEGLWRFEDDRTDERLVFFAVDLLLKADRRADAEAHLWRAFAKAPSLNLYARMRALGGEPAAQCAIAHLREELAGASSSRWHSPADLLIRILSEEKMFDAAWDALRAHGGSRGVKEALAEASEASHATEALEVYADRVEQLAGSGGNPAYEGAAALIGRMASLRDAGEHAAYVAHIRARHGRKRNFMKLFG